MRKFQHLMESFIHIVCKECIITPCFCIPSIVSKSDRQNDCVHMLLFYRLFFRVVCQWCSVWQSPNTHLSLMCLFQVLVAVPTNPLGWHPFGYCVVFSTQQMHIYIGTATNIEVSPAKPYWKNILQDLRTECDQLLN